MRIAIIPPDPYVAHLRITPPDPQLTIGDELALHALALWSNDREVEVTDAASWRSSNTGVLTVSADGVVTAIGDGGAIVTATFGSQTATISLVVGDGDHMCVVLVSIAVTPVSPTLTALATQQMTAMGTYSDASQLNITSAVTWTSSDVDVATISNGSAGGLLTALGVSGVSTITATLGGISGNTGITVQSGPISAALALAQEMNLGVPALTFAVALKVSPETTGGILHLANRHALTNAFDNPLPNLLVAVGPHNGVGGWTDPSKVWYPLGGTVNLPGGGNWSDLTVDGIEAGTNDEILIVYGVPNGSNLAASITGVTHGYRATGLAQVNPLPSWDGGNPSQALCVRFDYEPGAAKKVVTWGDSISVGYSQGVDPVGLDVSACFSLKDYGYAVDVTGVSGSKITDFTADNAPVRDKQLCENTCVVIETLVNALPFLDQPAFQSAVIAAATQAKAQGAAKVIVICPTPSLNYAAYESRRQGWLTWLRAGSILNVDEIWDADAILRDPADHTILLAAYTVDGLHWSTAGHAAARDDSTYGLRAALTAVGF